MFKTPPKFDISDLSLTVDSNVGFGHSIQHLVGTNTQGRPIDLTVRVTNGYRKIDGNWLTSIHMSRCPLISPPPSLTYPQSHDGANSTQARQQLRARHSNDSLQPTIAMMAFWVTSLSNGVSCRSAIALGPGLRPHGRRLLR
jgi:hypothetical protein